MAGVQPAIGDLGWLQVAGALWGAQARMAGQGQMVPSCEVETAGHQRLRSPHEKA